MNIMDSNSIKFNILDDNNSNDDEDNTTDSKIRMSNGLLLERCFKVYIDKKVAREKELGKLVFALQSTDKNGAKYIDILVDAHRALKTKEDLTRYHTGSKDVNVGKIKSSILKIMQTNSTVYIKGSLIHF